MKRYLRGGLAVLAVMACGATTAKAQSAEGYVLSTQGAGDARFASLFGVPAAMTPPKQTAFVSVSGATPRDGIKGNGPDYDMSIGYGFGNPFTSVGGMVSVDITGTQPFADGGSFSMMFSRAVSVTDSSMTFIGVSASDLGSWGVKLDPKAAIMASQYRVVGAAEIPLIWTLGYGQDSTYQGTTGVKDDGAFWGVGIGPTNYVSLSMSGTENQVNAGATVAIPGVSGLALTAGRYDLANKSKRQQDSFAINYSIKLGGK